MCQFLCRFFFFLAHCRKFLCCVAFAVKWNDLNWTHSEKERESVLVSSVAKWGWCKVSMHANLFENHFIIEFLRFFKSHMFELQKNGINSLLNIGNLFILIRIFRNENVFCATPKLCKIFFQLHHCQWCSILITRKPTDLDDSLLNLILVCSTFQRSRSFSPGNSPNHLEKWFALVNDKYTDKERKDERM